MKVLYITNGITGAGGLERVLSVKASLLADDYCHEVHILSLNEKNKIPFFTFSDKLIFHSANVFGNPLQYFLKYKRGIQKLVDEIKPDVILVCDDGLKGFSLPWIISAKAKWMYESHASLLLGNTGSGLSINKKIQHQLKQILGKRFSRVIILTEGNRTEWKLSTVMVIPNPAPFETSHFSDLQSKKVIAVGSCSYNKGYDLLIKIWQFIEEDFPDWELHIFGKNTQRNLMQVATNLHLNNVHCHDPVINIREKYVESSILVLPSRSEGFGMVLIEAMSFGLPVVSFDCPNGPRDIISNNTDGFLIENGNIREFAGKLKSLMLNEELRQKMGKRAQLNVQRFSARKILKQWDDLFRSLIHK